MSRRRTHDLTLRQIGAALGVSHTTARDWLRRGLVTLEGRLLVVVGPLPTAGRPAGAKDKRPRRRRRAAASVTADHRPAGPYPPDGS